MCLGIPGQVVEILDEEIYLAKAEVGGVRRNINIGLVHHEEEQRGDRGLGLDPRRLRHEQAR